MPTSLTNRVRRAAVTVAGLAAASLAIAGPAAAAQGSIDHVEAVKGKVQVLYSLPAGATAAPDLASLKVSLDNTPLKASAELASQAKNAVRRTAVLAMDVSNSMRANNKFTEAKRAAELFLNSAPSDLYVGIVTFSGNVAVVQKPSLDRGASAAVLSKLTLSSGTHLYDGVSEAVAASGTQGQRSVILLSDGRDTSRTPVGTVTKLISANDVKLDVVTLDQSRKDQALLRPLSSAGSGNVINAGDPAALSQVFATEAETLAKQILITADTPSGSARKEGNLSVSVASGGTTYTDSAYVSLPAASSPKPAPSATTEALQAAPRGLVITPTMFLAGLGALGLGVLVILVALFGGGGKKKESLENRISVYTRRGAGARAPSKPGPQGVTAQALGVAEKALQGNKGLETKLGDRLDAAGMSLKPAEWLLLHAGIALGATAIAFAFTGGSLVKSLVVLLVGALIPWMYLGFKRTRRVKAFDSQLAPCLQLMAGSLQAGLSLAQSIDTVVREGAQPLADEFRRALVETRLGVPIEDAMDSVGERMGSDDFRWTVMAVRIQREVGGNLAELLLNVAATLREREYLRRQVKALSAEGRFSAYILLALPPGIIAYMMLTRPTYLHPMVSTSIGFIMIGVMVTMMVLGALMMKKLIKVEV